MEKAALFQDLKSSTGISMNLVGRAFAQSLSGEPPFPPEVTLAQ
jgi:hypothetical protein